MSLIFAGVTPHPPILIPSIGKDNLHLVDDTVKAMKIMEQELYARSPEVIITISPHGTIIPNSFAINICSTQFCGEENRQYTGDFEDFGDFSNSFQFKNDIKLAYTIYDTIGKNVSVSLIDDAKLDHGCLVPLFYLAAHLPNISIIPISYSLQNYQTHVNFGKELFKVIEKYNKRVAVIASGDLSHCLTKDSPAGYNENGQVFDNKIQKLLEKKDISKMIKLNSKLVEDAGECGLRSLLILMGLIKDSNCKFKQLSYEGPFGVGYLVGYYDFA